MSHMLYIHLFTSDFASFTPPYIASNTLQHQFSLESVFWVAFFFNPSVVVLQIGNVSHQCLNSQCHVVCLSWYLATQPRDRGECVQKNLPDLCHSSIRSLKPSTHFPAVNSNFPHQISLVFLRNVLLYQHFPIPQTISLFFLACWQV